MEIEVAYVRRYIKTELEDIAGMMLSGVDDFSTYQNLVGRAAALQRLDDKLKEYEQQQAQAMGDYNSEETEQ